MTSIFEDEAPIPLDELVTNTPSGPKLPEKVARNEAAYTALMTAEPVRNYQTMMAENQQGSSETMESLQAKVNMAVQNTQMQDTLDLVGRKDVPMEMKQQLIEGMKNKRSVDPKKKFLEASFVAPSEGETLNEQEARLTTAAVFGNIFESAVKRQAMTDAFAASRRDDVGAEFVATTAIPGAQTKVIASASKPGLWNTIKGVFAPGSQIRKDQKYYESLPPEGKADYLKNDLIPRLESMNLVGWGDAHLSQIDYLRAVTEGDEYFSTGSVFLLNLANVLDVVGAGFAVRSARKASQGAKTVSNVNVPPLPQTPPVGSSKVPGTAISEVVHKAEWEVVDDTSRALVPKGKEIVPYTRDITPETLQISGPKAIAGPGGAKAGQPTPKPDTSVQDVVDKYDEVHRVEINGVIKQEQPMAPLSAMLQSNPQKARETLEAIKQDVDGEFTKAMTGGNTPEQALMDTLNPSIVTSSGRITAKPAGLIEPDDVIQYMYQRTGATALTDTEKAAIHRGMEAGWRNAEGLTIHDGMGGFKISEDGNYANISAVYGTPNGSFLTPEKAIEQAEFALRRYGVSKDDITILARDGIDYKPVKFEDVAGKEGDYRIQIEHRQAYSLSDDSLVLEPFTIKRNWFDNSLILAKGGVSRSFFDPASIMDPKIHIPVGTAVDKSINIDRLFLQLSENFAKDVKALDKGGQAKVMDYIYMADEYQVKFDPVALKAQGWTTAEVEAVRKWKAFNDNQYYFENEDLIRTLTDKGYMKYVGQSGEDYIAKPVRVIPKDIPIAPNQKMGTYLDPVTGKVEYVTKVDEAIVHAAGGTYAKLRRPVDINGTRVEYILVRNDPQEYLRAFRNTDTVLGYRDGHFTRYYEKGAKFIDEVHTTSEGKEIFRRAVAVGPDTPSAKSYKEGLDQKNTNSNVKYVIRDDAKGYVRGSDEWWDVEAAKGRISQKHRGQTLGGFGGVKHFGEGSYIVDPVTSSIRAAQSMGQRMGMRTALETAKARIEKQYGHLFPGGRIPATLEEIGSKGQFTGKEVADARASVAYIRNVEQGYQNLIDQGYKQLINTMGNFFGEKGFGKIERVVKSGESFNPSAFAKQSVFYSYIVLGNPIRQILLQGSAGLSSLIYRPNQWIKGQLPADLASYGKHRYGAKNTDFGVFVDEVGILASVHKNNMVSDSLSDLADKRSALGSAVHTVGYRAPLEMGFGAGERLNQLFWHSAVWNEMKAKGLDMTDPKNVEIAASKIRALTGEMNQAGNLAYSQGSLGTITQFLQVPHKVMLSMMTNRKLTGTEQLRYAAANILLYGSVGTVIADHIGMDIIPDDDNLRYLVTEGAQAMAYNELFKALTGDDTLQMDFSSFNSLNLDGWMKMFMALGKGDVGQIISQAPAAGLYDPDKGRIALAIKELARFASFGEKEEGLPPATAASVMQRVAEISSGFSSYAQAHMALEAGRRKDAKGNPVIGDPTEWQLRLEQFGLKQKSQREYFQLTQLSSLSKKEFEDTVTKDYDAYRRILNKAAGGTKSEVEEYVEATTFFMGLYKDNPQAMQIINKKMSLDLGDPENKMFRALLSTAGIIDRHTYINRVNMSGLSDEQKKLLITRMEQEFPETKE